VRCPEFSRRGLLTGALGVSATYLCAGPFRVLGPEKALPIIQDSLVAMGTRVSFLVRHPEPRFARSVITQAMAKVMNVHATMTLHDESPLTHLNRRASTQAVWVPDSLLDVLLAGVDVHRESGGVFDPSLHSAQGGMQDIEIDAEQRTVRFHHADVSVDLNGIAKGYAVDVASDHLRSAGIEHFIVNAGGDLYASGHSSETRSGWSIHLESNEDIRWQLSDRAVATSGNVHQQKDTSGRPIPHLIDPRSGAPIDQYQSSTIIAERVMLADAWSTALFVGERSSMTERIERDPRMRAHSVPRKT